jgi:hypothetical protein
MKKTSKLVHIVGPAAVCLFGNTILHTGSYSDQEQTEPHRIKTPGEWSKRIDHKTKSAFWTNNRTGESKWDYANYNPPILADFWDDSWDGKERNPHGAVHQIVLVRHGQYVTAKGDENKVLTPLGREQACITGKRLRELLDAGVIHPIDTVYYSTMTRATETHGIIQLSLPPLPAHKVQPCSMIREGAAHEVVKLSSMYFAHNFSSLFYSPPPGLFVIRWYLGLTRGEPLTKHFSKMVHGFVTFSII